MELEQEFAYYAALSKVKVVKNKMVDYFRTLEQTEVNLSGAFYESPEDKATKAIDDLILHNNPKFERLYEAAYAEIA